MKSHPYTILVSALIVFAIGTVTGWLLTIGQRAPCQTPHTLISKSAACGTPDVIRKTGYAATRAEISQYIESSEAAGKVAQVSIYFRDLEHGPVLGVNELDAFAPASLLKLPLAFVFLSAAEDQPGVLEKKINYSGMTDVEKQRVQPSQSAEAGKDYTIEELLHLMLTFSDNASYEVLEEFLSSDLNRRLLREEAFQELGLVDPKDRVEATISVRGYASLFRILYNASYLNASNSEKVLSWLAQSEYVNGLVAGVPKGVLVSHKFGERFHADDVKELHDCGIVYFPNNPYLLCVMTRGSNWQDLEEVISSISRMVYEEVDSRKL